VKVQVLDAKGQVVRTLDGTRRAGLNRVTWDLRGEPSKQIQLRTSPEYAPAITVGPEGGRRPKAGDCRS
jgi:flagellar hook assembly protein FlgD